MLIGGFQKFSLIDYPGKICAIIFTQGCNFRCPYCYNIDLVIPKHFQKPIPEEEVFAFLEQRKGKLDAVEITGGEPTLQSDLINVIKKIKSMGFLVKLDSNGSNPKILEKIIGLHIVDYFAMDIKNSLEHYEKSVGVSIDTEKIRKSIRLIMNSGADYEFRTTMVRSLIKKEDVVKIGKLIKGAKLYALQSFNPLKTLQGNFTDNDKYSEEELNSFADILRQDIKKVIVR